jgi:hypothetical protein
MTALQPWKQTSPKVCLPIQDSLDYGSSSVWLFLGSVIDQTKHKLKSCLGSGRTFHDDVEAKEKDAMKRPMVHGLSAGGFAAVTVSRTPSIRRWETWDNKSFAKKMEKESNLTQLKLELPLLPLWDLSKLRYNLIAATATLRQSPGSITIYPRF